MPRASKPCPICSHASRRDIDAATREGVPPLDEQMKLSERFKVTRAALERHIRKCEPAPVAGRRRARAASEEELAPDSGPRLASEAQKAPPTHEEPEALEEVAKPLPPARELATPVEELNRRAQLLTRHLEREDLEPRQVAQVSNALAAVDRLMLAREKSERPIHEHPDFDGLVEDLVDAVVGELGPRAPEGIEGRIAEALEHLQAERASGPALRRAA